MRVRWAQGTPERAWVELYIRVHQAVRPWLRLIEKAQR